MEFSFILIGAVVALVAAWAINAFVGILSGEQRDSIFSTWWDLFSNMDRSPAAYAEPLPDAMTAPKFEIGDRVRLQMLPLELERSMPGDRWKLFQRCTGKVLRVEGIDEFGAVELHVLDDGSQSPDSTHHILFIEAQYLDSVNEGIS